MKRVLSILAAMVMILAAVPALGEEIDPIVGVWYCVMDFSDASDEIRSSMNRIVYIYAFEESGNTIMNVMVFDKDKYLENTSIGPVNMGTWSKDNDVMYRLNVSSAAGRSPLMLLGDKLVIQMNDESAYVFHKMQPLIYETEILPAMVGFGE